jgi:ATP-dependent DNA ligase
MKTLATATLTHVRWQMPYHSHPQTQNIMGQPLTERRRLLETQILPPPKGTCSISLDATLPDLIRSVKAHGLEGLVAKGATGNISRANAQELGRRCASTGPRIL